MEMNPRERALIDAYLDSLLEKLNNQNEDIRELGARILQIEPEREFSAGVKERLLEMVKNDDHRYARFHAAYALYLHGDRSLEVASRLEDYLEDSDDEVRRLARKWRHKTT